MRTFHAALADEMKQQPQEETVIETAIARRASHLMPLFEPNRPAVHYAQLTRMEKIRYFIRRHPITATAGGFGLATAMFVLLNMTVLKKRYKRC